MALLAHPLPPTPDARRVLRLEIARLEQELASCDITAFAAGPLAATARGPLVARGSAGGPRLLGPRELEAVRDALAARLDGARRELAGRAGAQDAARRRLAAMHRDPRAHRGARVTDRELGAGGCGAWAVRPRLGLVGMLAGWWEVKHSSGCPRAGPRRRPSGAGPGSHADEVSGRRHGLTGVG